MLAGSRLDSLSSGHSTGFDSRALGAQENSDRLRRNRYSTVTAFICYGRCSCNYGLSRLSLAVGIGSRLGQNSISVVAELGGAGERLAGSGPRSMVLAGGSIGCIRWIVADDCAPEGYGAFRALRS